MTTLMEVQELRLRELQEVDDEAVDHALAGRWEQALAANSEAIRIAPDHVEAYNRQAKALIELGRYKEAQDSAEAALKLRPGHAIAKRNLERISQLLANGNVRKMNGGTAVVRPAAFIADRARSTVTVLRNPAPPKIIATVSPGDPLKMDIHGTRLKVSTVEGQVLGNIEVRLAQHLTRLVKGGNRYEVAVAKTSVGSIAVIVRETARSPRQANLVSFPPALQKYSAVRTAAEFEDDADDAAAGDDAGAGADIQLDEEDIPQPEEASSERLRAILHKDSTDDGMVSDDALAV